MSELDWAQVRVQACEVVRDAGSIIRKHWDQPRQIQKKGRIDLVTQTDLAVEKKLRASLQDVLPKATFLAEETANDAELGDLTWVIDPLDGTTNYAHSIPFLCTSVGLWHKGAMRMGIIYNPIHDEFFWALKGKGAFFNDDPMHVSQNTELEKCVIATGFPYAIRDEVGPVVRNLESVLLATQGVRRCGAAALDLAYVACGRMDGFYEPCLWPWDTAAGWLLVEEAGGRVTQFNTADSYQLRARTLLATNGHVHEQLSGLLEKE